MKRSFIATTLFVLLLTVGCQSKLGGGCAGGNCGLLGGGCNQTAACSPADGSAITASGANSNFVSQGGRGGPLAGMMGRRHRGGPQSHLGSAPGPAQGHPAPTYGYPYYTTRGPRDFLNSNPPSIGR